MRKGGFAFGIFLAAVLAYSAPAKAGYEAHFPSPDHVWTWRDYNQLYFVHADTNLALPHTRSRDMARLFERLVDRDNINRVIGRSGPDDEKIRDLWGILATLSAIRARYNLAVIAGEPLAEELTRVQAFMLYALEEAVRLSEVAMQSPSGAWKTCFLGVVESLSEADIYSPAQRVAMATALADHFTGLRLLLTSGDLQGMRVQVETLATGEPDAALRQSLQHLLAVAARG